MNEFILLGVLEDIELLDETPSGIKLINFVVKVTKNYKSNQPFDEFRVTAFKDLAEEIALSAIVGQGILIKGRLQANNYRKDDKVYYSPELLADKIMYIKK